MQTEKSSDTDDRCWTKKCKNKAGYVYRVHHEAEEAEGDTYCQLCEECLKHYDFLDERFITKII